MKKLSAQYKHKGFTLIELLVVIVIIATLAVTVFVALNPAERISDARDARRTSDVDSILTAIHQYIVDNGGLVPTGLTTTEQQLGTAGSGCATIGLCTGMAVACLNLSSLLAPYLASIPIDPNGGTAATTRYSAALNANGIVTVKACGTEDSATPIQSSR